MLNKKACKQCRQNSYLLFSPELFQFQWDNQEKVVCSKSTKPRHIRRKPPKNCEYMLEHLV
jgi:hypothetical protein